MSQSPLPGGKTVQAEIDGEAYSAGMDMQEFFRATDPLTPEARAHCLRLSAQVNWRRLMYYRKPTMARETFDGRKAAAMGLVNEAVPRWISPR